MLAFTCADEMDGEGEELQGWIWLAHGCVNRHEWMEEENTSGWSLGLYYWFMYPTIFLWD